MDHYNQNPRPTTATGILLLIVLCGPCREVACSAEVPPTPVITVIARKSEGILRTLSLTGTVTARRQASLSSRANGLVMDVRVDAGSIVRKGDVLLTLDTRLADIALDLIRAEITQGQVELEDARRLESEVKDLVASGGFAKSEAESRKSAVRVSEAKLLQLQAREREQMEIIERHQLIAPFGGVISRKLAEEGEWVSTGTPVLELVETENPRFDIQVPQEFVSQVTNAESVVVTLDAHPGESLEAVIEAMVPVKDNVSRTFLSRLELPDSDVLAAPGMSGTAEFSFHSSKDDTVQIPRDAVVRFPDGSVKVWVVSNSGDSTIVKSKEIKTGGSLGKFTEVIEGLEGGEQIVLKGNEGLREEQTVKLKEEIPPGGNP